MFEAIVNLVKLSMFLTKRENMPNEMKSIKLVLIKIISKLPVARVDVSEPGNCGGTGEHNISSLTGGALLQLVDTLAEVLVRAEELLDGGEVQLGELEDDTLRPLLVLLQLGVAANPVDHKVADLTPQLLLQVGVAFLDVRDQLSRVLQVLLGVRVVVFFAVVLFLFAVISLVLLLWFQGGLSLLLKLFLLAGNGLRLLGELFLADSQLLLGLGGCGLEL